MKFQSLCSTRSSSLCAFLGVSSSSNYGAMKLGIIRATTSLSFRSSRMTVCAVSFRPCIDIHKGKVKQIVGSTLRDSEQEGSTLLTNFESDKSAAEYANLYKQDGLTGGHAIMLGADPLSIAAAIEALHAYPGGLQVGGGINSENASRYIEEGASHVIVTSYVFNNGQMDLTRLKDLVRIVGKQRLVLDLSCRKKEGKYAIVTDRWQKFSDVFLDEEVLAFLADYADEFLVHGVDVEGKKLGIDEELVTLLGKYSLIPVTYAGGVTTMADLERIKDAGKGRVDVTVGSALDIFGGNMAYKDVVAWHAKQKIISSPEIPPLSTISCSSFFVITNFILTTRPVPPPFSPPPSPPLSSFSESANRTVFFGFFSAASAGIRK
ncbi:1-(5-phosphoribosyl)-5-[(5-phosphoribosylamino)methylideneamino] imidazole-4-carboxamide isomerase, chloroplastic isoform X1 [Cucurbita moschata]|uniref:1-(5-phosphoribosyl)-5-[(5-phosphoribosylamino)methylideneamino] imidazole-4-carboxamide isomerase HISN3, chloroplastic n=1 Tax=Cucurbita moschata TaxID=3662 RepID=A0A6J1EGZ7_CUCMO|nr:1-(5-phosphoribosyl)-5-[(5-phosphoribosylamino)methylideneamino] imidazole-4-carboxamide isomerase, chloroplastic isoform X1 [Cucurbita moschata]